MKVTGIQARAIGRGFANYVAKSGWTVWACAIMPDHVYLVTGPAHITLERATTVRLVKEQQHPFGGAEKCWARGEWKVYLDPPNVPRAIRYAEDNPLKEGKPRQSWDFVTPHRG